MPTPKMPKMRNVSTTYQEKYQTEDGNVTVTNFKRGLWQVMPRGKAPFTVGSKAEAFRQAAGISSRHWGMPKSDAFPRGRSHATKSKNLAAVDDALGYRPEPRVIARAEEQYGGYSTNELRREVQSLEDQFEMSGGRGVGLADRLDAARIALALRGGAKRSHAAKKAGLSADQRAEIDAALGAYGARLTDDDRIAKGDKVMSVQLEAKGGRLKMVGAGNVLASYPASRAGQGVSDFVEKFWFWKKAPPGSGPSHARVSKAPRYVVVPASGSYGDVTSVLWSSKNLEDAKAMAPRGYVVRLGDQKAGSKWYRSYEATQPVVWER